MPKDSGSASDKGTVASWAARGTRISGRMDTAYPAQTNMAMASAVSQKYSSSGDFLPKRAANVSAGGGMPSRGAVADPPVLILDEATSSIDTRTEQLVQKGMDQLMQGRTSFVIAHRLSTVKNADCIMVLEQGRIIERGTHEQLLTEKGRYYQLYTGNAIGA